MDKVRLAIVGCGNVSQLNGQGYLKHPNCEVNALCDPIRDKAQQRARQWGIKPKIYTDYADVLSDPDIDAIELLTPTTLHAAQIVAGLGAGKHISCQKPICTTVAETTEIVTAVARANVRFRITENFIYYPPIVKAKELIDNDAIGEPSLVRIHAVKARQIQTPTIEVDPDAYVWRQDPQLNPEGLRWRVYDHAAHVIATAMYWVGDIENVFANVNQDQDLTEAPSAAIWKFKGRNCLGLLDYTHSPGMTIRGKYFPTDEFFEIHGSKGMIWVTRCQSEMHDLPPVLLFNGSKTTGFHVPMDLIESFNGAAKDFIDCIIQDRQPRLDVNVSKKVLQVSLAMYEASRTNQGIDPNSITIGSLAETNKNSSPRSE